MLRLTPRYVSEDYRPVAVDPRDGEVVGLEQAAEADFEAIETDALAHAEECAARASHIQRQRGAFS
jgi:hypothetical protein